MSQSSLTCFDNAAAETSTYRISREARKTNWVLLIGAASIWVFAVWTIITLLPDGIELGEIVTLILMAGLIVVAPFLMWNIAEEMAASYTVSSEGLSYRSIGIQVDCSWRQLEDISERATGSFFGGESAHLKIASECRPNGASLAVYLHRQAHGTNKVKLYQSLDRRDELETIIKEHIIRINQPAS